jgi:hypothetical protein
MITALHSGWSTTVGTTDRARSGADLEAFRARAGHDPAAGHCRDCDGFLEVQARSGASGLTAAMVGVASNGVARTARAEDRVTLSPAGRAAAMRGTEDAGTRSRSTHEVERALDTEAVDPLTRRAGTPREIATPEETAARGGVAAPEKAAAVPGRPAEAAAPDTSAPGPRSTDELALAELRQIAELQARDREVRAHEQAHKAVAGPHGGAMSFQYQTGPDGRKYAVGGEVAVDLSTVRGDPQATIDKMEQVRRAALAPAEPSSTDRAVAARAAAQAEQARAELRTERDAAEKATAAVEGARTEDAGTPPPANRPGPAGRAATAALLYGAASARPGARQLDIVI